MEIKEFIVQSIRSIEAAIKETSNSQIEYALDVNTSKGIHFNLAVTGSEAISKSSGKGIGAKLKVVDAGIGANETSSNRSEYISRIEFNIQNREVGHGPVRPDHLSGFPE